MFVSMHTYVHTPYVCTLVCVYVSVCVCVYKSEMTRAELRLSKLIVYEVNSTRCPVLPRPLFFPLAEPQFEPQRVHSVQVVSEQPLVSDKTQVLVQLQG